MEKGQESRIQRDNSGFSLIELVIVIAIIAILTGLFTGMYLKYVEKSKIVKQEDVARKMYDAATAAVLELVINENEFGCSYDNVTPKYHDPVTGKTCGMITTAILGPVASGSMSPTGSEETRIASYIIESVGGGVNFSSVNPAGSRCNFSDGQARILMVFDEKGIFRLEYGEGRYLTTVAGGEVTTQKYASGNAVNFSNPS